MKTHTKKFTVTPACTANVLGSGSLDVLATPMMVAWMENTAMEMVVDRLAEGDTTVGVMISADHMKASAVGAEIECIATLTNVDGRKFSFEIECRNENSEVIGRAVHHRVSVNAVRFMGKL